MNTTVDRIERAYADVVAVEEVARGLMRVVSWSSEYYVDAAGSGCDCPDKTHNLPEGVACKHEASAIIATRDDLPGPWDPAETLDTRDGKARGVMTDGGEVIAENVPSEEIDEWIVYAEENASIQIEGSKREANKRAEYVESEFADLTPTVYGPGEHPHLSDDEAAEVSDAAAFHPEDYDNASAAINAAPTQVDAEWAMGYYTGNRPNVREAYEEGGDFEGEFDDAGEEDDTDTAADKMDAATVEPDDVVDTMDDTNAPEPADGQALKQAADDLPERHVDEDPLKWLPHEFVDTIDGSPAINRKGFEVLGHFYDVDVTTELEVAPEDTAHEYARVKATAQIDGRTVDAYGSAHVDRGDDHYLLLEMAGTPESVPCPWRPALAQSRSKSLPTSRRVADEPRRTRARSQRTRPAP